MKEQSSRKNTTRWQRDSQLTRCTVQNTGNQDAHRIAWIWSQITGKNEGYANWTKGKCTENQQWWEGNQDWNQWCGTERRNIQPEQNEERSIQKNEEMLRNLQNIFRHSNIWIIGVPEGEEEEQGIENLFEKIMKENFPNLAKEIDFQEVQEAESPKEAGPKEEHTKAHHKYISQD